MCFMRSSIWFDVDLLPRQVRLFSAGLNPCAVETLTPRSRRFRYAHTETSFARRRHPFFFRPIDSLAVWGWFNTQIHNTPQNSSAILNTTNPRILLGISDDGHVAKGAFGGV